MLLINEPHDLQAEDFFDYKQKGDAIVELLKSGVFNKNKMFALYGDWGSGKTSLMKYISTQLDQSQYKTFFFEAWKHEKDEDMNTSLLEMITESLGVNLSTKEFLETIASGIKAFGKGLSYESKLLGLKFDLGKIISGTEEELKVLRDEVSFYTKIKIFSEKYRKIESSVLDNERKEKLIVFIDDLDRCETHNIIDLLTTIKLFFTLGNETIFFFGVDKKAIQKAVYSKYQDVIKAEEYLEKIFDVTFNMPVSLSTINLIHYYFKNNAEVALLINHFFYQVGFRNPRHLKKVLNKFKILQTLKNDVTLSSDLKDLIPDITDRQDSDNFAEIVFVLYFILLSEFYPEKIEEMFNIDLKRLNYGNALMLRQRHLDGANMSIESAIKNIDLALVSKAEYTISNLIRNGVVESSGTKRLHKFLMVFTPLEIEAYAPQIYEHEFLQFFNNKKFPIEIGFCQFLIQNKAKFMECKSEYIFRNFRQLLKLL